MVSLLRIHGGKGRLARRVVAEINLLRKRYGSNSYVEPYAGGASVFLALDPPFALETLNDVNSLIFNWWCVFRDQREELIKAILATPYSREGYAECGEPFEIDPEAIGKARDRDALELARRFTVYSWGTLQGAHGKFDKVSDWRRITYLRPATREWSPAKEWRGVWLRLVEMAGRMHGVQLENRDALQVVKEFDDPLAIMYVDPPYLILKKKAQRAQQHANPESSIRTGGKRYIKEMTERDQVELFEVLSACQAPVLLSGYETDLHRAYLKNWKRRTYSHPIVSSRAGDGTHTQHRIECLWIKPQNPVELSPTPSPQRRLDAL